MKAHIIVIGGSAGSLEPLIQIVRDLPPSLAAAIFVVIHRSKGPSQLAEILRNEGHLPVSYAQDGFSIESGNIYLAPADYHIILKPNHIELSTGPKVNLVRPAIDVLFQSAAFAYGNAVIGLLLSGFLDDGSRGLFEIKRLGGKAIVQDPTNALFPQMPENALKVMSSDYVLPTSEIASVLLRLVEEPLGELTMKNSDDIYLGSIPSEDVYKIGKPSTYSCPHCGGVLAEMNTGVVHFTCRVGHSYSMQTLLDAQSEVVDDGIWMTLRASEEAISYAQFLADHAGEDDKERYTEIVQGHKRKATILRGLLRQSIPLNEE